MFSWWWLTTWEGGNHPRNKNRCTRWKPFLLVAPTKNPPPEFWQGLEALKKVCQKFGAQSKVIQESNGRCRRVLLLGRYACHWRRPPSSLSKVKPAWTFGPSSPLLPDPSTPLKGGFRRGILEAALRGRQATCSACPPLQDQLKKDTLPKVVKDE